MLRKCEFAVGEYYHVYNRGVEKRDIFLSDADRERFLRLLFLSNGTKPIVFKSIQGRSLDEIDVGDTIVAIGAYVLMPNHFHILVKEITEGGLSTFMSKLTTGYSMYFNKKHERVGALFQNRFKAEHVDRDEYLKYLFSYIHLNPVKLVTQNWNTAQLSQSGEVKNYLAQYPYSSYLEYTGTNRPESRIINQKEFPEYFEKIHDFEDFIDDWLAYHQEKEEEKLIQGPSLD